MALAVVEAGGCVECVVSRMTAARLLICCHSIRRSSPSFASRSSQVTTDMQRHFVSLPHTHTHARARARALIVLVCQTQSAIENKRWCGGRGQRCMCAIHRLASLDL
eukprot:COSAG03_NODE_546_length_7007_cov_4.067892_4_plen_107_part_00